MPSKIPLGPNRGRVASTTPAATPPPAQATSSSNATPATPASSPTTPTTKSISKPTMIPRVNFNSSRIKAKTDSGLTRKKPIQKHVTIVDPIVVVEEERVETVKISQNFNLDVDVSSPIKDGGIGHIVRSGNVKVVESGSIIPTRGGSESKKEILEMRLENDLRNLEAEEKDDEMTRLQISDVGINVLMFPKDGVVDTISRTPFEDPAPIEQQHPPQAEIPRNTYVDHVAYANSGFDAFYDENIILNGLLLPQVDDANKNYQWQVEEQVIVGDSIQDITAPTTLLHETVSDPKLCDYPSIQSELKDRPSICEEEQPPFLVESIDELVSGEIVAAPLPADHSLEEWVHEAKIKKSSTTKTLPISKETPTTSNSTDSKMTSSRSIKKSFSEILIEATSKTNEENLELLEDEMSSFLDVGQTTSQNHEEVEDDRNDEIKEETNGNENQENEPIPNERVNQEEMIMSEESLELEQDLEKEPVIIKKIVRELTQQESLEESLAISASNLRHELTALRSGVNEMQMWGSITMYLASGVIIGVLAMENFRGFMETSFAPPEPPTAVGWLTSMYRTVFGGDEQQ